VAGQASRLLLHARELALHHPHSGQWLTFCEPAPF
jgi:23S rRNA-/tRNA-specific pseudouridylate synthase